MKRKSMRLFGVGLLFIACAAFGDSVWDFGGGGNWSSVVSPGWTNGVVPNAIDAVANANAASGGTLSVDGIYTIGTLKRDIGLGSPSGNIQSSSSANKLIFDVSSGTALIDLGTKTTAGIYPTWNVNIQLNDNVVMRFTNTVSESTAFAMNGLITGTGGFILETGLLSHASTDLRLTLNNATNSFEGGVVINPGTSLWLGNSGAAGTGLIAIAANRNVNFSTVSQTHSNAFSVVTSSSSQFRTNLKDQTINLYGNIAINGSVRFGAATGSASNSVFILSGNNKIGSTVGAQLYTEPGANSPSIVVNNVNALPDIVYMRGSVGVTSRLLYNVAGTFTEFVRPNGDFSSNPTDMSFVIGTTDTLADKVTIDSDNDAGHALSFLRAINGMTLTAGNAGGTFEVITKITDEGTNRNLTVVGPGTVVLSNSGNAWGGATTIASGTLRLNSGTLSGTSVTVNAGATLAGSGTVTGKTTINGILAPGASVGELAFTGDLTLGASSTNVFEINGTGVNYDYAGTDGALTYGGVLQVVFGYAPAVNATFDLFDFGSQSGTFSAIQLSGSYTGDYDFSYSTGVLTVIPEPGTLSILGFGLVATLLRRKLRKI